MRKFFNNKSAFTLTELVVSMGITGVLIVSTIYLVDLANKSSTNDDLAVARQTIEELMGNRKICESTLAIQPLPLLGKTPIPVIKNASTNLLESSGVDAHIKDATQGTTLAARITAENALTSSHAKFGKRVMVGEMYVKDLGAVTDGEEGAKGEIKSTTALRLLEFSVLLAVKNSQEKAGNKVKGYTKKVIFTGVVDTTVNPMVIQSCAADVSFGKKEAERALCEDMGGPTAWDRAKGICKKEEVQRAVAKKAVAVICASDTGIGGNLDSSGTTCSPPYWGKNCHFCGTNFWVKKIGPQGEVTCTNGSNDCFSNQCMLVDKSGTAKASTCTGADPEFGGTPSTHGDCSPAQTGYKLVAGTCLPSCKKRAALQGISTANYKLIAATQCRDALYGGIEWDDFTDSVKTYDTQGTDMVCCAKQGIVHTPPSCTNTCPPGQTLGPYPGCACSGGSPQRCPVNTRIISRIPRAECGPMPKCGWKNYKCLLTCQEAVRLMNPSYTSRISSGSYCRTRYSALSGSFYGNTNTTCCYRKPTCSTTLPPCQPGETRGAYPGCACSGGSPQRCPSSPQLVSTSIPQSECGPLPDCGWKRGACRWTCNEAARRIGKRALLLHRHDPCPSPYTLLSLDLYDESMRYINVGVEPQACCIK